MHSKLHSFYIASLYRPLRPYQQFLSECSVFLCDIETQLVFLLSGNFNIQVNQPISKAFLDLTDSTYMLMYFSAVLTQYISLSETLTIHRTDPSTMYELVENSSLL